LKQDLSEIEIDDITGFQTTYEELKHEGNTDST